MGGAAATCSCTRRRDLRELGIDMPRTPPAANCGAGTGTSNRSMHATTGQRREATGSIASRCRRSASRAAVLRLLRDEESGPDLARGLGVTFAELSAWRG